MIHAAPLIDLSDWSIQINLAGSSSDLLITSVQLVNLQKAD